jgi:hypothetical protein
MIVGSVGRLSMGCDCVGGLLDNCEEVFNSGLLLGRA